MTLLVLMAIPSFVALCFLAAAHTLQTMNLRLAETAPLPVEALLQEFFPAAPAMRTAHNVRIRTYEHALKAYAARSSSTAFYRESNMSRFPRLQASFLREYRRNLPDSSFRNTAASDTRQRPLAPRALFERRRPRLGALARRPRSFSTAFRELQMTA